MRLIPILFLLYIGIIVPRGAWRSYKHLHSSEKPLPPRRTIYFMTLFGMAVLFFISIVTAWYEHTILFPSYVFRWSDLWIAVALLALKLGYFTMRIRRPGLANAKAPKVIAPQTSTEKVLYCLLVFAAAISEEIAYRGVAFQLLANLTGNILVGAVISAVAFGLSHILQGRLVVVVIILLSLIDQWVVYTTGSLYYVMAVHLIYDLIAGFVVSERLQRLATTTSQE